MGAWQRALALVLFDMKDIDIHEEKPEDYPSVRSVLVSAFESPVEADLVERLREKGAITLSLVALEDGEVVGHILFTPVSIEAEGSSFEAVGLAPMAVLPERQRKGIGVKLVKDGLDLLREKGHEAVVVLGHPDYYPRFGFLKASTFGLRCEFDAPDEAFMVIELEKGALSGKSGVVRFQPEFAA